jgi:hypothetical protein
MEIEVRFGLLLFELFTQRNQSEANSKLRIHSGGLRQIGLQMSNGTRTKESVTTNERKELNENISFET